jgi:hypothetical protein
MSRWTRRRKVTRRCKHCMASFVADYHETEEALPLVYNVGRVSLEWNMVEQFFTATIWEMLGDYPAGMAVTGGMGNVSKADVVLRLSRQRIRDKDTLDAVEFACKAFNILRQSRNVLIHSHSIYPAEDGGKPIWRRASGKGPSGHLSVKVDFEDLENLIAQICALGVFTTGLVPFLHRRRRKHWPHKVRPQLPLFFPMPTPLFDESETKPSKRSKPKVRDTKRHKKRSS